MRWVSFLFLGIACVLAALKWEGISLWSAGLGTALGMSFFTLFATSKTETPVPHDPVNWPEKFHDLQTQTSQTIEELNKELQKLQQKMVRTEDRCLSYQKLVDVHQGEVDRLKAENEQLGKQLIEKERKISELQLARLEPDLFDTQKRQMESSYRELKKQLEDKAHALDQTRSKLSKAEKQLAEVKKSESHDLFG